MTLSTKMSIKPVGRVAILFFILSAHAQSSPDVTIQAFRPKGVRVSIQDPEKKLNQFVFQGNVNRNINVNDVGQISGEVIKPTNGAWVFEDPTISLKPGDVINYYVFVTRERKGYVNDNLTFTVTELVDPSSPAKPSSPDCKSTVTEVAGGKVCAGQVIFEDNFDRLQDLWYIEQYIPDQPDYPFVSYQRPPKSQTVAVDNGYLRIAPQLQQDLAGFSNSSILSGTLDLTSGCTSRTTYSSKCSVSAWGASILPPVVTGRLTTKLAFKYGVVEVRAKLPKGDWLYPDIGLEPLMNKYGFMNYASGLIRIAGARGNNELNLGAEDLSNKVLYGGPIMDFDCRGHLLRKRSAAKPWSNDFHTYSARWEPGRITLAVDGIEWARIEPSANGFQGLLGRDCPLPRDLLATGSNMAPFDDYFYLTLGVAAGGISEFPDGSYTSGSRPKPWRNPGRKASLNFWQDIEAWWNTWTQPLIVDYVRIRAI
ncbi:unnamed protein product [Pieris macdunnoughi]|uniref:Uncharacterized protein n=2 Tax=Pieris macdunnoughi TaxID=345717 RepID=A0A821WHQ3_9NEOP|nr:unnamed protein product [Pieris macdunnoughi]